MPTVVEAFVVEFGIDPSKFTKGQREAMDAMRGLEDQAIRGGKNVEASGKKFESFLGGLKRGALGGLTAALGAGGAAAFFNMITRSDAAVGRLSYSINQNVKEVSAWQGVAKQMGGTGEGAAASLQTMTQEMNQFQLTGQQSFLPLLNRLNVGIFKQNGQLKEASEVYLEAADAIAKLYPNDPARRASMLQLLPGMNQETINLLINGRTEMSRLLDEQRKIGVATKESAEAAQQYEAALSRLQTAAQNTGRTFITAFGPALSATMDRLQKFIQDPFGGKTPKEFFTDTSVSVTVDPTRSNSVANIFLKHYRKAGTEPMNFREMWEDLKKTDFFEWEADKPKDVGPKPMVGGGTGTPEGEAKTRADRNHNPGNIEYGAYAIKKGAIGHDGRFAIFKNREDGFKAAQDLLATSGYKNLTLAQIGERWAPKKESHLNQNWAANVSRATGIPMDRPLTDAERERLARAGLPAAEGSGFAAKPADGSGFGARTAAAAAAPPGSGTQTTSTTTNSTHIGTVVIHTASKDPDGIARTIEPAIRRNGMVAPVNAGAQ